MTSARLMDLVNFLKEVPFFSEVDKVSLLQLCKNAVEEQYPVNRTIIRKGELGEAMYVILEGHVRVHDKDHVYRKLHKGECFGEYALIDSKPRSVSVTAEEETLNEGTLSHYGNDTDTFYTLILRNMEDRLLAENKITSLESQTEYLQEEIKELTHDHGIIAEDESMKKVLELIQQVAQTQATVLVHGETGTGKELVARAIHRASDRSNVL